MTAKPVVLAIVSDIHAGSTVAPCPPEGVRYDDGGRYTPSKLQLWLWAKWEWYWREVAEIRARVGGTLGVLCNGDATDGPGHHGTHQSIDPTMGEAQGYVVDRVFSVPKALAPDWWVLVRGTESHVGKGAESENYVAKSLGAEKEPETQAWTWYHWNAELYGYRVHATHHGRSGGRPWTRASALGILASEILQEHVAAGVPHPHLAIRSHKHEPGDSGDDFPVRVLLTAAWQPFTSYAHQVVPEKYVNRRFGGDILIVWPNGRARVERRLFRPDPTPYWRPGATD